ncbi:MAG TPA: tRNA (adenosine(37)-N6)-dimethylallyltransferase MiaA, partial [Chthoniobacteraceae bacterium]
DLLTAKPEPSLLDRLPHHLVGEIDLTRAFDVAQYASMARARITEIHARGKVAVVCGGTGLYVRALTHGLSELPQADATLRAELEAIPLPQLHARLAELDPVSSSRIDLRNPRRVVRALEVCLLTGEPFSRFIDEHRHPLHPLQGVILNREKSELDDRIDRRTHEMFSAGGVEEVSASGEAGPTASQAIGLRQIRALLAKEVGQSDCISAIQQATRRYAKRQMTWFRRETAFEIVNLTGDEDHAELCSRLAANAAAVG